MNRVGAFLLLPIYTNYLAVSEYGALELFYATTAVISGLLSVGIAHATLRFYFSYKKQEERNAVVSTNLLMSLLVTIAGASIIGIWYEDLVQLIFKDSIYSNALNNYIGYPGAGAFITGLSGVSWGDRKFILFYYSCIGEAGYTNRSKLISCYSRAKRGRKGYCLAI